MALVGSPGLYILSVNCATSEQVMSSSKTYSKGQMFPNLLYFAFNIVIHGMQAFQVQFIKDRWGLGVWELGLPLSFQAFAYFGMLYWTWLADRSGRVKQILLTATICYTAALLMIFLNANMLITKEEKILLTCAVFAVSSFFRAALLPIIDAVVMSVLSSEPHLSKDMYGRQRLWGDFGTFVASATGEIIVQKFHFEFLKYMVMGSGALLVLIIVLLMPKNLIIKSDCNDTTKKTDLSSNDTVITISDEHRQPIIVNSPAMCLLTNPGFLPFLLFIIVSGIVRSLMSNYVSYFVHSLSSQSHSIYSLAAARSFSEVLVFGGHKAISISLGAYWMLILSQAAAAVRSICYGLIPVQEGSISSLIFIPLELLKGMGSALMITAAVRLAYDLAPPGVVFTAQGLLNIGIGLSTYLGPQLASVLMMMTYDGRSDLEQFSRLFLFSGSALFFITMCFFTRCAFVDKVILQDRLAH